MNITKDQVDNLNAVVSLKVEEEDYRQRVEDMLKDYRKKANIPGFRPGKVPMGMIRKMYYKPVLADEINRIVGENLMKFIQDEKLQILGEPMAHDGDDNPQIDFENDHEFEFKFDLGLAPEFEVNIDDTLNLPFYKISVQDTEVDEHVDNVAKRQGEFIPVDAATGDELLKGNIVQLGEDGKVAEDGIAADEVSMSLDMIKDDEQKELFKGKKQGDKVVFQVAKAYPNEAELSSLLKIDKDVAKTLSGNFEFVINEVLKFEKHEVNQELFDNVYGEGTVKSEEEFREKLKEELEANYERESNYKFAVDVRDYFVKEVKIELPTAFLKRWLAETNENLTKEQIEDEFSKYEDEFRWQLIKNKIVGKYDINVSDEELFEYSVALARNQFYQYGLYNVPDEHIESYAREQMTKPEEARRLREQKYDDKVVQFTKDTVKLDEKEVTVEAFRKLFEN
ncbi:MAG TPA: trigger factor [Bacteroidales bacterium]|nr:trigger factor [Bacteroidales bacterium]